MSVGKNSAVFSWKAVKGAAHYGIWQYNGNGKYTKLANTAKLSYTVTDLTPGTAYAFLIRAYNATGWNLYTVKDNIKVTV